MINPHHVPQGCFINCQVFWLRRLPAPGNENLCPTASGLVGDGLCCGKLASASHTGYPGADRGYTVLSQLGGGWCQQWHVALLSPFLLSFLPPFLPTSIPPHPLPPSLPSFLPSFLPSSSHKHLMSLYYVALVVKNPPANAGDIRDSRSVSGSGRSPGVGNATHSSILASSIPWTEEPGRLQFIWLQNSRTWLK